MRAAAFPKLGYCFTIWYLVHRIEVLATASFRLSHAVLFCFTVISVLFQLSRGQKALDSHTCPTHWTSPNKQTLVADWPKKQLRFLISWCWPFPLKIGSTSFVADKRWSSQLVMAHKLFASFFALANADIDNPNRPNSKTLANKSSSIGGQTCRNTIFTAMMSWSPHVPRFPTMTLVLDKETCLLMKQFSLLEIISTATVLLAVVVESSRVFHVAG